MTKKTKLYVSFISLIIIGLVISNLYNTGKLSKGWAYFAVFIGFVAISIAIYGFFTQTIPKFKSIFDRFFKKRK